MSKSWSSGSSRRWRRLRAQVLANNRATNGGRCRVQLSGVCTDLADTVHHTKGRSVTGDDPRYLQASCTACNLHIGDPNRPRKNRVSPPHRPVSDW